MLAHVGSWRADSFGEPQRSSDHRHESAFAPNLESFVFSSNACSASVVGYESPACAARDPAVPRGSRTVGPRHRRRMVGTRRLDRPGHTTRRHHPVPTGCAAWVPGLQAEQPLQPVDYLQVTRMQLPAEPAEWPTPVDRPGAHWRGYYLGLLDGAEPQLPGPGRQGVGYRARRRLRLSTDLKSRVGSYDAPLPSGGWALVLLDVHTRGEHKRGAEKRSGSVWHLGRALCAPRGPAVPLAATGPRLLSSARTSVRLSSVDGRGRSGPDHRRGRAHRVGPRTPGAVSERAPMDSGRWRLPPGLVQLLV